MKRYIYILVASTFLVSTVKAQLSYGVKAGGALTWLPNGIDTSKSLAGYYAGVFGAIPLHKKFSLQAELYYSTQGGKELLYFSDTWDPVTGYSTSGHTEKIHYRLTYLNLPVLIKYKTSSGFFVDAGLQAGLLLGAHAKFSERVDVKDSYKSFDFSAVIGAGYKLSNGLGVDLRYNYGLTNVSKWNTYKTYNIGTQLGLFYVLSKH